MRTGIDGHIENSGANFTYKFKRQNEIEIIRELIKKGHKIEFGSHNWIVINGKTFNGWNKELLKQAGIEYGF